MISNSEMKKDVGSLGVVRPLEYANNHVRVVANVSRTTLLYNDLSSIANRANSCQGILNRTKRYCNAHHLPRPAPWADTSVTYGVAFSIRCLS